MKNRNPKLVAEIEVGRAKSMIATAKIEGWTAEQTDHWKEKLIRAELNLKQYV